MPRYKRSWADGSSEDWQFDEGTDIPTWAQASVPAGSMYNQQRARQRNQSTAGTGSNAGGWPAVYEPSVPEQWGQPLETIPPQTWPSRQPGTIQVGAKFAAGSAYPKATSFYPTGIGEGLRPLSFKEDPSWKPGPQTILPASGVRSSGLALPIIGPSGTEQYTGTPYGQTMTTAAATATQKPSGPPASEWDAYAQAAGVDMKWWNEFKAAERPQGTKRVSGVDPITYYLPIAGNPSTALQMAQADKAWGDQFFRTYGRGPTEDDWKWHWNSLYGSNPRPYQQGSPYQNLGNAPAGESNAYSSSRPVYRP